MGESSELVGMVAMNRPDPEFFWRAYAALGPAERRIMELKALLGAPTSKTIFLDALRACGTPCPGGKSWSATSLNPILDELARLGLLDQAFACVPALTHRLARHAAESPASAPLLEGLGRALPRSIRETKPFYYFCSLASDADLFRRLRLAIYANEASEFARLIKIFRDADGEDGGAILARFLGVLPADAAWLESRKPPIQAALAASSLAGLLDRGLVRDDLSAAVAILTREAAPSWDVSRLLIRRAVLAGAFGEALARAEAQGPGESHIPAAVRAAIAFLSGDDAMAVAGFREALKLAKKRLAKRKITLDAEFGLLHVLALMRAHDASLRAEIRALLDIGLAAGPPWTAGYVALEVLFHLASGQESCARNSATRIAELAPDQPFARALVSLAELTRAGRRPTCITGPVRCTAAEWHENQHARWPVVAPALPARFPGGAWRPATKDRKGRERYEGYCTPVTYDPTPNQVADSRRDYLAWWAAIHEVRERLLAAPVLRDHELTSVMPPVEVSS